MAQNNKTELPKLPSIEEEKARANGLMNWGIILTVFTIVAYVVIHISQFSLSPLNIQWHAVTTASARSARALDWALWSLAGTLLYLLTEVSTYYQKLGKQPADKADDNSFIFYTPWYLSTLIRGPVISVVILFFLNAANLNLTGAGAGGTEGTSAFSFNFSQLDHTVTLFFAFVLGFYSRVSREVLDGIMKSLFPTAWANAYEDFDIDPAEAKVVLGETCAFKTKPAKVVDWAASLGSIDEAGKYTAPSDEKTSGTKAVVTATSGKVARSASIMLIPFEIVGSSSIKLGDATQQYEYRVSKAGYTIAWTLSPAVGGSIDAAGKYTPPADIQAAPAEVIITATVDGKPNLTNSLKVSLEKPAA